MEALTKWIGSKVKFLDGILPLIPGDFARYYEPFVGGGSLFLNAHDCDKFIVNDDCAELMELYREAARPTRFFLSHVRDISASWRNLATVFREKKEPLMAIYKQFPEGKDFYYLDYIEAVNPVLRTISYQEVFPQHYTGPDAFEMEKRFHFTQMKSQSKDRIFKTEEQLEEYILTSLKMSLYSYYTELYNSKKDMHPSLKRAILLFLLYFSTNGQFVYDRQGEFRPVYAGVGHNLKSLDSKITQFNSTAFCERMEKSELHCLDFRDFFRRRHPQAGDFIMVDPPLGAMCKKVGNKIFSEQDLTDLLLQLKRSKAKWMLLVKQADIVRPVAEFSENHFVTFVGPHQELAVITNYDTEKL